MRTLTLIFFAACSATACTGTHRPAEVVAAPPLPPPPVPVATAPEAWKPALARADAALGVMQGALLKRVNEELAKGGPVSVVKVCSAEAPGIAAEVARAQGLELGRTSFRLRNPANAPRAWATAFVGAAEGKKAKDLAPMAFDLGDKLGVLKPIPTGAVCLTCHGATESIAPEVKAALGATYPADRATGFLEGDLRGFMWAEVAKAP